MTNLALGARLTAERKRLGFNQTEFGALVGASKRTLIRWESGDGAPDADALAAWADKGLDVLYVVTGADNKATDIAPDEELLLDSYRQLSAGERRVLLSGILSGSALSGGNGSNVNVSGSGNRVAGRNYKEGNQE